MLRRNLFLDPEPTREYLVSEWTSETERGVRLTHEPRNCGKGNLAILELHPILKIRHEDSGRPLGEGQEGLSFHGISCSFLQTVHPSTLVFQPPLMEVIAYLVDEFEDMTDPKQILAVFRAKGVTFGGLLDDMQPKGIESGNKGAKTKDSIRICASSAISNDADEVRLLERRKLPIDSQSSIQTRFLTSRLMHESAYSSEKHGVY